MMWTGDRAGLLARRVALVMIPMVPAIRCRPRCPQDGRARRMFAQAISRGRARHHNATIATWIGSISARYLPAIASWTCGRDCEINAHKSVPGREIDWPWTSAAGYGRFFAGLYAIARPFRTFAGLSSLLISTLGCTSSA